MEVRFLMADKKTNGYTTAALLGQLGFTIAVPILLGAGMGRFLDKKMDTGFVFFFILLILGVVAGLVAAYKQVNATTGSQSGGKNAGKGSAANQRSLKR